jgi:hypothetical protein
MVSKGRAAGGFRREEVCRGVHWPHVQAQQRERGEACCPYAWFQKREVTGEDA